MSPVPPVPESLGAPPWMTAAPARAVMTALQARGGPGCARFVGGCVRNTLIGDPVGDVDIATLLTPDHVIEALEAARLRAVPTGVEHGTVTAVVQGIPYEITTLRRDVSTDGRRAVVSFTEDWSEDAQRRDFRFNAVYADLDGRLYDPTGRGVADALARRVIFVGDPMVRLREDYLRILRYFRFLAWYGEGEPDRAAVAACEALRGGLVGLAAERISKELLKLLAAPDPRASVRLMAATDVLPAILPFAASLERFDALVALEAEEEVDLDPELRLAALAPDDVAAARSMAQSLRLSNALRDRLVDAAADAPPIGADMTAQAARRALFRLGRRAVTDRLKLGWAASGGADAARWRELLALAEAWTVPVFPLTGEDALAMGVAKGPGVGHALRAVETWWIDQDFPEGRDEALARLKAVTASESP